MMSLFKKPHKLFYQLWFWVIIFMCLGIIFGMIVPGLAQQSKIIIDIFIHVIKIVVGPIIFVTVITGIIGMNSLRQLGSIGVKSLIYFVIISTLALVIGILFGYVFHPGSRMHLDISQMDPTLIAKYVEQSNNGTKFTLKQIAITAIPYHPIEAFTEGKTLQILFMSLLAGLILSYTRGRYRIKTIQILKFSQHSLFKLLSIVMLFSPIAGFAAMAFMISQFGIAIILPMFGLIATMFGACLFFILLILGGIAKYLGFNILHFIIFIKDEIMLIFATSSSESALGPIMLKLKKTGIHDSIVGIVIPTGYSFNLDGTNIYLALALIFLCNAFSIHLQWQEYGMILLVLMLTSKGAAGVSGAGFIVLASTISSLHGKIPVETIVILLGIDKIIGQLQLRSVTNMIGNCIATLVVAHWEKKLDIIQLNQILSAKKHTH
jgi:aerobic C4-dicarboxylate transport protein